jgi:hypothetical protein
VSALYVVTPLICSGTAFCNWPTGARAHEDGALSPEQPHNLTDAADVIGDPGFHRRRHANGLMYAAEVVLPEV